MDKVARLISVPPGAPVNEYLRARYPFLASEYVYYTITVFNNNMTHVFVEVFGKPVNSPMDALMVRTELETARRRLW